MPHLCEIARRWAPNGVYVEIRWREVVVPTIARNWSEVRPGLIKGNVYELAIFNAERHMGQSNFRIDTTMAFADCGRVQDIVY